MVKSGKFSLNLVFLLIFLVSGACSRLDVAVSFMPRYMANQVDEALDLSSDRYRKLKEQIESDLNTNKKIFISTLITRIDELLILTNKKEITEADAQILFKEIKKLQKKAIYIFKPSFSEVILRLSAKEVMHLNKYAMEKFKKTDERLADKSKYYKHYNKLYEHYMSLLFDATNDKQDRSFEFFLDANHEYFKLKNFVRKNFLRQFEVLFEKKNELLDFALKYYASDEEIKSGDLAKKEKIFNDSLMMLGLDIWKSSSDKQKISFRKNLLTFKEDFRNLIKQEK